LLFQLNILLFEFLIVVQFCIDYQALNEACTSNGWPLPKIKEMLARLGGGA
jgi:hypothetical protein